MASVIATRDGQARTTVKSAAGPTNLPTHQAQNQFVPTLDVVRLFQANSVGSWGTYSEFVLTPEQMPHIVEKVDLQLTLGAATKTGGTVISFVNDAAFLSRLIEVSIGSELISSMYPEGQYFRHVLHLTNEEKTLVLIAAGNDTLAHRQTKAAAGQTLVLSIPVPWINKYGYFTGQQASQLRIKVYHAALSDVVQTDGTAPVCAINSVQLAVSGRNYLNSASAGALVQTQRKLGRVDERFLDPVQQQFSLISGSASYTLQFTNFVGVFDHLKFVVRAASSVGTPLANSPDTFVAVASYSFSDGGGNVIFPTITSAFALGPYTAHYVSGNGLDNGDTVQKLIYALYFGNRPEESLNKGTSHGFYRMGGTDRLTINFASAISANYVVDVVAYQASQISADAQGIVKRSKIVG